MISDGTTGMTRRCSTVPCSRSRVVLKWHLSAVEEMLSTPPVVVPAQPGWRVAIPDFVPGEGIGVTEHPIIAWDLTDVMPSPITTAGAHGDVTMDPLKAVIRPDSKCVSGFGVYDSVSEWVDQNGELMAKYENWLARLEERRDAMALAGEPS
jgi:hypothetical protein